jgi:membrane protein
MRYLSVYTLKRQILTLRPDFSGHKLFVVSFKKFLKDDCFTLSLSISFVFLMSIIPFATLSLLVIDLIQDLLFAHNAWAGQVTELLAEELNQVIPFVSREWMKAHVINPDAYSSFKAINFLMLPIISGLIFKTLETSYRRIFELPARHLLLGQAIYVTMSIFAVLLFFIANYIWIILSTSASHFLSSINKTPYLEDLYEVAVTYTRSQPINVMSLLVLIGFYLVTVKLFLNVKIRWRYQLFSAVIFCLLWLFARKFFGLYIQHISEVNLLYGSLSSVILFLLWIFYSSMALLFSLEVLHVLHRGNWQYRWW